MARHDGPHAWMESALCAQTDPEIFFPERGGPTRDARRVCSGCPVQVECLAGAGADQYGIRAGLSERARVRVRVRGQAA